MPDTLTESASDIERQFGLQPGALGTALNGMIGQLPVGLCIQDAGSGRYLHVNKAMASLFGLTPSQIVDHIDSEWLDPLQAAQLRAAEQFAISHSDVQVQTCSLTLGGEQKRFVVVRQALKTLDGAASRLLCCIWLEEGGQRLETGRASAAPPLPSSNGAGRALFDEQFRRELDLSNREHREFSLVTLAVDAFKPELARHGELANRRVEQMLAALLRSRIRAMDSSFCIESGRFALLLSGVGLATAHSRVEALRRQCAIEPVVIDGEVYHFTVSIGVASYPHTTREREALLAAADQALELARQRGGNHVALASIRFEGR